MQTGFRRLVPRIQDAIERLLSHDTLWAVVCVVLLTPVVSLRDCAPTVQTYRVGEVAASTIKAPDDIELADEQATRELREAEREQSPPVYDMIVDLYMDQRLRLGLLFERGRALTKERPRAGRPGNESIQALKRALPAGLPTLHDDVIAFLMEQGFSPALEEGLRRVHTQVMQGRIVRTRDGIPASGVLLLREVTRGTVSESTVGAPAQIRDLAEARAAIAEQLAREFPDRAPSQHKTLARMLDPFVVPNLSYNASETETRRAALMAGVPQVFIRIPRGRVIVREGELFTAEALAIIATLGSRNRLPADLRVLAGNAVLIALLALFLHRYVRAHQRLFRRVKNLYTLVLVTSMFVTMGAWVGQFLAESVADRAGIAPWNDPRSYCWALPVAAGAMLITLLANGRVATVASAFIAALFGMAMKWDASAIVFALISSFAAIYGVTSYGRRAAILKASALVAIVNVVLVFALDCVRGGFTSPAKVFVDMAAAALGGVLAAPIVSFSLPILEWTFNVLTDIRLLELSNLDNPLLRRLSIEAPGTYNHSVIVGTLAEQAAEEIGAHALLCRVGAYYHDIGKMSKPDYFIENMREGANRHDRLSPRMSSLIIANHVKEGLRLAQQHNLPRQIRDIIPQHHGTRLITFFYRKARKNEDPDVPEIQEVDYRYPGPKPQSKEAAIFMMADSVEAAARTVEEPTPARFEEVITMVSNAIILDHQLDECDLTFSDLSRIRASFSRTLAAVHHHRITYPGFEFDRSRPRGPRSLGAE